MAIFLPIHFQEIIYYQIGLCGDKSITGYVQQAIHDHGDDITLNLIVFNVEPGADIHYETHLARKLYSDTKININAFLWVDPQHERWDDILPSKAK
jgi:hypothetical protein